MRQAVIVIMRDQYQQLVENQRVVIDIETDTLLHSGCTKRPLIDWCEQNGYEVVPYNKKMNLTLKGRGKISAHQSSLVTAPLQSKLF